MKSKSFLPRAFALTFAACSLVAPVSAQDKAEGKTNKAVLKDLNDHFPFTVPATKEAWEKRAEILRRQIKVSLGLLPMPSLAPLKPTIHSRKEMDGYAVEKIYMESLHGLYLTGSLYTPTTNKSEKMPAVLCPHGHWTNGRFLWFGDREVNNDIAIGAERFESAARSPLQARCVQLARMGCVVFHFDMIGYADSVQIDDDRAHGFGNHGPNPKVADNQWLLFSPKAEGLAQNVMGLQTINTIQALEYVLSRPDVDPNRISITGASGGGTQTFIASAIDPRFAGAYPVVMVSTGMQGGCTCENACGLRVGTGNVEIAALTAPKPQGLNAANDWTKNMASDGYPQLKQLYSLYGATESLSFQSAVHFNHNYNHVTRVAMYGFMNRLFKLGLQEPILERDFTPLSAQELSVWDAEHPKPKSGNEFEAELLSAWAADIQTKVGKSPSVMKEGWEALLFPANDLASGIQQGKNGVFQNASGDVVATLPNSGSKSLRLCVALNGDPASEVPNDSIRIDVEDALAIDQGNEQSLVKNPRLSASYTYGYNAPLAVRRLATLVAIIDSLDKAGTQVELTSSANTVWMLPALRILRPDSKVSLKTRGATFSFDGVSSIRDAKFLPGALRYGDFAGLVKAAGM